MSSGISRRPTHGSAYAQTIRQARESRKYEAPGGHKLWCRLVVAFTGTAIFGLTLIILGGVFIGESHGFYRKHGLSLPLVWCIIGLVAGTIMLIGSFILGKLIISKKWRTDEQTGVRRATNRVHFARENNRDAQEAQVEGPPSYEQSVRPAVYFIDHETTPPPPPDHPGAPPQYTPYNDMPPAYTTGEDSSQDNRPPQAQPQT